MSWRWMTRKCLEPEKELLVPDPPGGHPAIPVTCQANWEAGVVPKTGGQATSCRTIPYPPIVRFQMVL